MPRSTTLLARGSTPREAMRALFIELDSALPETADPDLVVVIQARAAHDGSGFVAEAAIWSLRRSAPPPDHTSTPVGGAHGHELTPGLPKRES
jgi:hypothetical protein